MGKPDTDTREYIGDSRVFADVFNYFIYGGQKVVKPQNLEKLDASTLLTVFGKNGDEEKLQRYRDTLNKATLMTDDEATYIVLGIEAQTHIDYGMSIRTFLYDALQYDSQARKIKAAQAFTFTEHIFHACHTGCIKIAYIRLRQGRAKMEHTLHGFHAGGIKT